MNNKLKTVSKLYVLWLQLTQPSENISIDYQRKSHLLNQITLIFVQIITVLLFIMILFPNFLSTRGTFTLFALVLAFIILFSVFVINRLGYYYLAVWVLFASTHALIYYNAAVSSAPYLEIMYMILLPIVGILILDLRNTVILTSITLTTFAIFQRTHINNIPAEIRKDLSILTILVIILVIFVSHWRNKIEQETRQLFLEKEKADLIQELIANMSHDLKTPLTIINSSLYLAEKSPDADKRQKHIDKAKNQVWRLESYIQDMLAILRLEDKQAHHQEWVKFNDVITDICNEFSNDIDSKNLKIILNLDSNLSDLYTQKIDIYRMIQNLLKNSVNYTPDDGEIHITTYEKSNNLHFIIKDTGIGLSPEESKFIFDRFYRADKARSLATGGTGLGLSIVKRIVDINNGSISVDSKLNEGTTFTIILPIKPQ